jgi:hypothetical protein
MTARDVGVANMDRRSLACWSEPGKLMTDVALGSQDWLRRVETENSVQRGT